TTQALNTLPVPTYRWLKLNHLPLEVRLEEILPYSKDYLKNLPNDLDPEIILQKMNRPILFPDKISSLLKKTMNYGVSDELVALSENNYNSGVLVYLPAGKTI